jgi:subtilisin family serine protease
MRRTIVSALALATGASLLAVPAWAASGPSDPPGKIDSAVVKQMKAAAADPDAEVEALVVLGSPPQPLSLRSRPDEVPAALKADAQGVQGPVETALRDQGGKVLNKFWIKNMILVKARPAALESLAKRNEVDHVIPNFQIKLPPTEPSQQPSANAASTSTWGIDKIGAGKVQDKLGITGKGVRVAVLDTGIDVSHPDLKGKLATDNPADGTYPGGWMTWDATGQPMRGEPHDSGQHGTHVSGTIAGGSASGDRIGVAPDVELMEGLVLPGGSGTLAQVAAGMQWAIAPYNADGKPAGRRADIVNMSLGGPGYSDVFIDVVRNMRLAGTFPAFAIGNYCEGHSADPGNLYDSVAVGATDSDDNVPTFSCGEVIDKNLYTGAPAAWPASYVKPDVSAPGVGVVSSVPGGGHASWSGTSMATPHVAGTVALMVAAHKGLSVDDALKALGDTAFFDTRYGFNRPNPRYGRGRIDAYGAVSTVMFDSGISGTVQDKKTGKPIADALVANLADNAVRFTDQQGRFELRAPAGQYDLTVSKFGYQKLAVSGITVTDHTLTAVTGAMALAPQGQISGKVSYAPTGETVPGATVKVLGVPAELTATTRADGSYTLKDMPEGTYKVAASGPDKSRSEAATVQVKRERRAKVAFSLARPAATELASAPSDATQVANEHSQLPRVSADGRYVGFESKAMNLVPGDTNGMFDVFLRGRVAGTTERISVATDETEANGHSGLGGISDDGRYVSFISSASNLVPGDTNAAWDVFVRDRVAGTTERVSVANDGVQGDSHVGSDPAISGDGRYVAFPSWASNLVPGDVNGQRDIFVHDRVSGVTERVSVASDGAAANGDSAYPHISNDGRYVGFGSGGSNLIPNDTNGPVLDTFLRDRQAGTTEVVSLGATGRQGNSYSVGFDMTPDARYFAFGSNSSNLDSKDYNRTADVFVRDRQARTTERVSVSTDGTEANAESLAPTISDNGRMVAFESVANNLIPDDTNWDFGRLGDDVFLRDRAKGTTERISVASDGAQAQGDSSFPDMNKDGTAVVFISSGTNMGGNPYANDVHVRDLAPNKPEARFAPWDLRARPSVVSSGRDVTVTANVKNIGDRAGEYRAVLWVAGKEEVKTTVRLEPGESDPITFTVRRSTPGTYDLRIGQLTGQFTVTG